MAAKIVSAYVSNNSVPPGELSVVIRSVHAALVQLAGAGSSPAEVNEKATPSQIRKSITPEALISFEDGKPYKTLRRHLTIRGLTPESYREKWGLPRDYPMVASSYSEQRSSLAKSLGLGLQGRRKPMLQAAAPSEAVQAEPGQHEPVKAKRRPKRKAAAADA
ncbi:MucR family transcriptional regulator [Methylobacterium oxalidis]